MGVAGDLHGFLLRFNQKLFHTGPQGMFLNQLCTMSNRISQDFQFSSRFTQNVIKVDAAKPESNLKTHTPSRWSKSAEFLSAK